GPTLRAFTSIRLRGLPWSQPEPGLSTHSPESSRIPMLPSTWTMRWGDYRDYLIGEGLGTKTISRYVRWVRDADEWLQKRGLSLDEATATQIREWSEERVRNSHSCRGQASAALGHYWRSIGRLQ